MIAAVRMFQAKGVRSIDVGCMQVNLLHHPAAFPDLDTAFDPQANAVYAARFLTALYGQTRDWSLATAMYHSQTQERGEDYQRRVFGRVMTPMGPPKAKPLDPRRTRHHQVRRHPPRLDQVRRHPAPECDVRQLRPGADQAEIERS